MGADSLAEIPQMPQKLSAQAQKFGTFKKDISLGVRSPCYRVLIITRFFFVREKIFI